MVKMVKMMDRSLKQYMKGPLRGPLYFLNHDMYTYVNSSGVV